MLPFDGTVPSAGIEIAAPAGVRALFAECRDCEAGECFPSTAGLPAGWREITDDRAANGKEVLCPDCRSHADNPEAEVATPAFVHCGYRLKHVAHLAQGFATIRIHAGASPRPGGPDYPATFLADAEGLGELIRDLEAIRASIVKGEK
jgi:hypothetical protein